MAPERTNGGWDSSQAPASDLGDAIGDPVYELVGNRFPGVAIQSPVQAWAFLERFDEGITKFHTIANPTPSDYRWYGVCLFQAVRDEESLAALYKARDLGDEGARVNLAHLLPFLERGDEASQELQEVQLDKLTVYDTALFFRVLSIREETSGNLREALRAAEEAWRRIQGLPEYPLLAPSVLSQLAVLYARIGRSQRALWFLERGISATKGLERLKTRLRRASVLVALGRLQEARLELESQDLTTAPENVQCERIYLLGEIGLAQNNLRISVQKYSVVVELASALGFNYEEFLARLALVTLLGARRDFAAATEHITRAQELISDKADRLSFRFREVLLMLWQGLYTQAHAIEELLGLIHAFGEMGLLQEQAAVKLHLADLYRTQGRSVTEVLDDLQTLSVTLQNPSFLAREFALLPELRRIAEKTHPRIAGTRTAVLEVHTLGEERVVLDEQPVSIPLKRGVEVLAYLLERKAVTLQDVIEDVFSKEKTSAAKSYFHQFRHQLREHVEGLVIEYDSEAKMYRLTSEINVIWDVAEVRAGRQTRSFGKFLPGSSNEWAKQVDAELETYRQESTGATVAANAAL